MQGFAVQTVVQALDLLLLGDAQAGSGLADQKDQEGDGAAPNDGGGYAFGLLEHAVAVAGGVDGGGGEDAGEQGAENAAHAVHAEGVQAVVVFQRVLQPDGAAVADRAGQEADDEGALGIDEARGRGDGDQAGDDAGEQAQQGGLLVLNPLHNHPAQGGDHGGQDGVQQGHGGDLVGGVGRAGVEADPAHQQQGGADGGVDEVVGRHVLAAEAAARSHEQHADQARDAGIDVHHRAAGEVEHAGRPQETAAPDPVGDRAIDQDVPERHEQQEARELHPLGEGAGDQGRGDDGEGQLVAEEQELRQALGQAVGRVRPHAVQKDRIEAADEGLQGFGRHAEGQGVADDEPEHGDDGRDGHLLGDGGQDVLAPHHAAIEERQARQGHEQDQGRGGDHPGGPARIEL